MSHQVQIDYQAIAIRAESVCEVAEKQIEELNQMLADVENCSRTLMQSQVVSLKKEIEKERDSLVERISELRMQAKEVAKKGVVTGDSDRLRISDNDSVEKLAVDLQNRVNDTATKRIVEMRALLESLLAENIEEKERILKDKANGIITISTDIQKLLDSISDEVTRQFTYLAYLYNDTLNDEALIKAGIELQNEGYETRIEKERERIRKELEAARVEKATIEKVVLDNKTLTEIRAAATEEIVGEKVRQKSLKIIMEAIKQRGFIVDKKNIKINREANEVIMVALKASGEKAEFRVFLDGKFIYDFRGYEGQACQKDIEPFMKDLEEVYGMRVTKSQEIWSNPDKISTMKYQAFNTNKNRR